MMNMMPLELSIHHSSFRPRSSLGLWPQTCFKLLASHKGACIVAFHPTRVKFSPAIGPGGRSLRRLVVSAAVAARIHLDASRLNVRDGAVHRRRRRGRAENFKSQI